MAWTGESRVVRFLNLLRMLAASVAAIVTGALTMAAGKGGGGEVELRPGDLAPDFELRGSDGIAYRLSDIVGPRSAGQTVVIAWFPKAFTGG